MNLVTYRIYAKTLSNSHSSVSSVVRFPFLCVSPNLETLKFLFYRKQPRYSITQEVLISKGGMKIEK